MNLEVSQRKQEKNIDYIYKLSDFESERANELIDSLFLRTTASETVSSPLQIGKVGLHYSTWLGLTLGLYYSIWIGLSLGLYYSTWLGLTLGLHYSTWIGLSNESRLP